MAITTGYDHQTGNGRETGSGIVTGLDRTSGMAKARRHTLRVRLLRVALPLSSLALVGAYTLTVMKTAGVGASLPALEIPRIIPEQLAMAKPHYEGFGKDGSNYVLDAKTAQQDTGELTQIRLNEITGTLVQVDKTKTLFSAARGDYNSKTSVLELYDKINVSSDNGFKAELTRATLAAKENTLVSKVPVAVEFTGGSVKSNEMTLRHKAREITFVDNVVARMVPDKAKTPNPAAAPASSAQMFETSDAPLDITSSRLDIKDADKTAIFTGNVKAVQNDQSLLTPELTVTYDADQPAGGTNLAATTPSPASGKIKRIAAKGPVILERGTGDRVTADAMDFDAPAQNGSLTGNVVMQSGADRRATSDRADLDQKASTALLTGNVFVQQAKNELKGGRLFIDRAGGRAQLTTPAGTGPTPGRIAARLIRGDTADKPKGKAKANLADSEATGSAGSVGSFKTDPNAPIDIDADQLDVNDKQKNATFRGDVKAVQGEFVIKTPELVATYSGDMQLADVTAPDTVKAPGAKKASAELTHIRANTKVNVTSKDGQSVDGDWADYDAKANTVVVGGEVVLSKGGSMIRGTRLLIDMTSGESTIETAPAKAVSLPGGGGWSTTAPVEGETSNRGRPSAVFFPKELQQGAKDKKDKTAKEAPASGSSSWNAGTTTPSRQNTPPAGN